MTAFAAPGAEFFGIEEAARRETDVEHARIGLVDVRDLEKLRRIAFREDHAVDGGRRKIGERVREALVVLHIGIRHRSDVLATAPDHPDTHDSLRAVKESGFSRTLLTILKTAVVAPLPSIMVPMTAATATRFLALRRIAYRASSRTLCHMRFPPDVRGGAAPAVNRYRTRGTMEWMACRQYQR